MPLSPAFSFSVILPTKGTSVTTDWHILVIDAFLKVEMATGCAVFSSPLRSLYPMSTPPYWANPVPSR